MNWKGGISNQVNVCKQCGRKFRASHKRKFCSQKCYWNFRKIFYKRGKAPQWKGGLCKQDKICENCGKHFVGYKTRRFCSKSCQASWKSKRDKNPNWKDGISLDKKVYNRIQGKKYRQTPKGKEIKRRAAFKRRQLGFVPLNKPFKGCEGHHIDFEQVIYIPKALHHSIWHSVFLDINMNEINKLAFEYLEKFQDIR